jgi:phosphotransferase system HPr (HPr) family protein
MIKKSITLKNPSGLHARPATDFAKAAQSCESTIDINFEGKTKNAKSAIAIMALGIKQGATFEVVISGADENEAYEKLDALVKANFNE